MLPVRRLNCLVLAITIAAVRPLGSEGLGKVEEAEAEREVARRLEARGKPRKQ